MPLSRINSASIANSAVAAADIADGTITAAKIVSIANTQITGNIVSSQITSVANTQISGNITAAQITSVANTQLTGLIQAAQIGSANASLVTSGTLPGARLPAGSVLQVITDTQPGEQATTSASFTDTVLTITITPTSATSKIFLLYTGSAGTATTQEGYLTIKRNSTNLGNGSSGMMRIWFNGSTGFHFGGYSMSHLDSPATTSATTYTVQFRSDGTNYIYIAGGNSTDTFTVMEIAA